MGDILRDALGFNHPIVEVRHGAQCSGSFEVRLDPYHASATWLAALTVHYAASTAA